MSKKKRIPVNSIGIKIREAREKIDLTQEELVWKINDKTIDEKKIKKWEKGQDFPNLDEMYKLATYLELNPNELLSLRNQIQDESQAEPNWFARHLFDEFMKIGKPGFKFIFELILGICIICLVANYKKLENKLGAARDPEQEELIEKIIQNGIDEYVYDGDTSNSEEK